MCYSEPEPAPLCRAAAATAALAEATPACDGGAFPDAAGFEGVEKRLELEFLLPDGAGRDGSAGAPPGRTRCVGRQLQGSPFEQLTRPTRAAQACARSRARSWTPSWRLRSAASCPRRTRQPLTPTCSPSRLSLYSPPSS